MDDKFYNGQEVKALFFPGEQVLETGSHECDRITVSIELNQLWFVIWNGKKILTKWNGMYVEGIDIGCEKARMQ